MFVPMVNIIARSTVQKFTACLSRDFGGRKTEDFGSTGEKHQGYVKRRAATVVHFAEILEVAYQGKLSAVLLIGVFSKEDTTA